MIRRPVTSASASNARRRLLRAIVRSLGHTGRHLLVLSSSELDPLRTSTQRAMARPKVRPTKHLFDPIRCGPTAYAQQEWQHIAPELHRLNLLTVPDVSPLAAYCCAAAQLRQAEECIEHMAKQDPRGHALTIEGSAGNQVTNPLLRIASQAMMTCSALALSSG